MSASPITIIGGGIAGLMAALAAAPAPVRLLNPAGLGVGAASAWSQGGLAAAIGDDDSPALHIADTLKAGAGLCDGAAVRRIIEAGPALIEFLLRAGVRFDRDAVENLRRLVVVRENDGTPRALEIVDGAYIGLHARPLDRRNDVADALINRVERHLNSFILKTSISYDQSYTQFEYN